MIRKTTIAMTGVMLTVAGFFIALYLAASGKENYYVLFLAGLAAVFGVYLIGVAINPEYGK